MYYAILSRNYIRLPMRSSKIGTALLWMILGISWPSGGLHWAVRYCRSTRQCCQKVPGSLTATLSVWNVYSWQYQRFHLWYCDVLVQIRQSLFCHPKRVITFWVSWSLLYVLSYIVHQLTSSSINFWSKACWSH